MTDLYYSGSNLGCTIDNGCTFFRIWAPDATNVVLNLYESDQSLLPMGRIPMAADVDGTWVCSGDIAAGTYYTYMVDGRETQDPYSKAVGCNGRRSMVVDLSDTNPEGFEADHGPALANPVYAIICETSVLDATADASSVALHHGKYLGMAEAGVSYFQEMGVTHVQLMPVYDFGSIDEARDTIAYPGNYNWGYDPVNYMVPEGSFSTDPHDGAARIREFKTMIQAFHRAGLGVIMDVVFNHTYDLNSCFQKTTPDYFYRKNGEEYSDGSACGNEVATDRPMVRKYILDCLKYWMEEYHLDGFRFDLMGCIDLETMTTIDRELRAIRPDVLLYGEGWLGGDSVLPEGARATKDNLHTIDGIGAFSDDIRDAIRGHIFEDTQFGYVGGDKKRKQAVANAVALPSWATSANRVINYASCHDNMTLWDRLCFSRKDATRDDLLAMNRLAATIVFTSIGVPFYLHGEEVLRSKMFHDNSFNLPLCVNALSYNFT
nr:type I pullulanase [Lachnospiraceae bacterium]